MTSAHIRVAQFRAEANPTQPCVDCGTLCIPVYSGLHLHLLLLWPMCRQGLNTLMLPTHSHGVLLTPAGNDQDLWLCSDVDHPSREYRATAANVKDCKFTFPPEVEVSREAKKLIKSILKKDPLERLTIHGIKKSAWFREGLPTGAYYMNNQLAENPRQGCQQSEKEIKELLKQAAKPPPKRHRRQPSVS